MIDLLVVGGGPVGLATAIGAATAGMEVSVIEPRRGPIDKACGEGLMPDALDRLGALGVDPPGLDFHGIRYLDGSRTAEARFADRAGRGVRRTDLSDALVGRAHEAGVRFVVGRVESIDQDDSSIAALGVRARYLVGADGLLSSVRRTLGLSMAQRGPQRFGVRQHFSVAPWTDLVEVHWLPDVEVYVTPVADDVVGVAVLGEPPLHLDAAIRRVPDLAARLEGAVPASTVRGAGPLRQRVSARHRGRALLVGDAAGYVDALTGEGLRVGFAEAEAAVHAILLDDPASYEAHWREITRSYRWLTTGLLWAAGRRPIRPLIVPAARALPGAFGRLVDTLAT
jgi:menaquinone-9 beta-reductase